MFHVSRNKNIEETLYERLYGLPKLVTVTVASLEMARGVGISVFKYVFMFYFILFTSVVCEAH